MLQIINLKIIPVLDRFFPCLNGLPLIRMAVKFFVFIVLPCFLLVKLIKFYRQRGKRKELKEEVEKKDDGPIDV